MRLVVAVVKPAQVEAVRRALAAAHVTRLTLADAHGYGPDRPDDVLQEVVLEIAVNDDFVERTVRTLHAALGVRDDDAAGRVLVLPMDEAVQIYRAVRGPEAV